MNRNLYIKNAAVFTPEGVLNHGVVLVSNGRIQAVGTNQDIPQPNDVEVIEASEQYLVPGFIDLQCNGGFSLDFTVNQENIWAVAAKLPCYGVTSFLPTIVTSPFEKITYALTVFQQGPPPGFSGATAVGWHVEGPFLNVGKKGAHNPDYIQPPTLKAVADWSPQTGVQLVTLAPEIPGALDVIMALAERGVVVSAGHSLASFAEAMAGFAAGIRYGTHLFNAMPAIHHREPGLIGALLADERVTVGLIPDGVHVHPALVKMVWEVLGNGRFNLVTDAMAALGMPPAVYRLGDYEVAVDETSARLPDGTLAGSIVTMDETVRNLMAYTGCTLAEALPTVTATPAKLLGLEHHKGQISIGYDADLVLLNDDLTVATTIVAGQPVYQSGS